MKWQWSLKSISKQSLCHRSPFWRRLVTYAICFIDKVKKHFVSLNNHTYETHKYAGFYDKSDRNWCFSWRLIFNSPSAQLFRPRRMGNSAGSEVSHRPTAVKINRCKMRLNIPPREVPSLFTVLIPWLLMSCLRRGQSASKSQPNHLMGNWLWMLIAVFSCH